MVRKLALAVSVALGTLSVPAHALGLGELSSKSALNQNFQGDISLLSVEPEDLAAVRVRLADADAFSRAGVDRPFYLSLLKFEPTLTPKGRPVIRVTSEFPIREPFMNFLVEVNWPNGRLLREYTVLLDPPTTTTRRPPAVSTSTKAAQATPAAAAPAASAPVAAAPTAVAAGGAGSEYGPVKANDTAWRIASRVRPNGVSMEQMMMALLNANPQAFLDGNINRLRRGQILRVPSLAEIQQLSRQDARQAYREQQDEWLARRDQRLQQAVEADATAKEAADAAAVDAGAVDAGAAAAAERADQLRIATARPEGSGEAGAGDDDALSPTASDLTSRLMVARENAETTRLEAEVLRSRVDELQARLQDMQRLISLKDEQLAQLQDRVGLEPAAEVLQDTLAEMTPPEEPAADPALAGQADAAAAQAEDAVAATDAAAEAVEAAEAVPVDAPETALGGDVAPPLAGDYEIADIPPQVDADRIVMAAAVEDAAPADAAGEAPLAAADVADEVVIVEAGADAVIAAAPAEPAPMVEQPPAIEAAADTALPAEAPAEAPAEPAAASPLIPASLVRLFEQNMLPIAGGGALLLALIGLLLARRRRGSDDEGPLVAASAAATGGLAAAAPAGRVEPVDQPTVDADTLADLPDSAFLDELSPADVNALQDETGEVDPVSEADVYIAYGRYQQAEELLRQAMQRDPERLALRHKLLEVHYATRNAGAFVALAQSMADAGQETVDAAAWVRAQEMGRELAPENPLFEQRDAGDAAGPTAAAAVAVASAAGTLAASAAQPPTVDDDTLSLDDLELSELQAAYEEGDKAPGYREPASEVSVLLDLEDDMADLARPAGGLASEGGAGDGLESIEFDLPEVDPAAAVARSLSEDDLSGDMLDLESMMAEAEAAVDQHDATMEIDSDFSAAELQAQLDELSELSVLAPEMDDTAEGPTRHGSLGLVAQDQGAANEDVDEPFNLDSEFSIDEGEDEIPAFLAGEEGAAANDAVTEDEVATKLDLARAYVDMGDDDGARSILEEVVVEGNDDQRGDAEQILAKIG